MVNYKEDFDCITDNRYNYCGDSHSRTDIFQVSGRQDDGGMAEQR